MNKTELITLLRDPNAISSSNLEEIAKLVDESPYFLSARLLLAKGSKELKLAETKRRIASAAVYSTDRVLLKKYISGDLFFLSQPPVVEKPTRKKVVTKSQSTTEPPKSEPGVKSERKDKRPSALKAKQTKPSPSVPNIPSSDLDEILEELKQDMENLRSSRAHFVEVQDKIEDEEKKASTPVEIVPEEEKVEEPKEIQLEDLKKDIEKEVIESEKTEPPKPKKKAVTRKKVVKKVVKKKEPEIDEDEVVNKKLEELAKKQEEIAAKVEKELALEKETKAKKEAEEKAAKEETEKAEKEKKAKEAETKNKKDKEEPREPSDEEPKKSKATTDEDSERAEKVIDEPRFSRSATRSYLRNLEVPDDDFIDFGKDDDVDDNVKEDTEPEIPETKQKKEELSGSSEKVPEKSEKVKKEPEAKAKEQDKKVEPTPKQTTKKSEAKKQDSGESAMPKNTIIKKAKLVKRKRSTRQRGGSGPVGEPKLPKSKDDDDGKGDRDSQQKIIEKFIKESPSIKYSKETEASTADLAENSTAWDKNLASEYLAEIYLKQGNKKRAIEIYEALSLKYPEKKSYFADLISKIK